MGMKTTRKRYSADFKAKVAPQAIRGDQTLAEMSAKHGVHHRMIASWKRQAIDGMAGTCSGAGDAATADSDSEVEKLYAKIGQLVVERDFLALRLRRYRGRFFEARVQPLAVGTSVHQRVELDLGFDSAQRHSVQPSSCLLPGEGLAHCRRGDGAHGPSVVRDNEEQKRAGGGNH